MNKGTFHPGREIASWLEKQEDEPVLTRNTSGRERGI
jgi:hypothetical protein